jgi:hypothetical protein
LKATATSGGLVELIYHLKERRTALAVGSTRGVSIAESVETGGARLIPP